MIPPIQLINLTTGYKGATITRNINAELKAGELTCLLGRNGAGKSTLLKTLCAFQQPLSGEILINGTPLKKISPIKLAQTIGVVLTERPSTLNMTVEDLVSIGRSPYTSFWGGLRPKDKEIVDEAISMVGIESLRDRNVSTLSDGERQKTMVAKAIAQQTQIIFLDEPTAFLDYPSKVDIMNLLFKIAHEENKTIFMSIHEVELAIQMVDKIWLLDKKLGLEIGGPEDLAIDGALGEYFQTDSLTFDKSKGMFEIKHPKHYTVNLSGIDGDLLRAVKRALNRKGYVVDNECRSKTKIEIIHGDNDKETILLNGESTYNIEDLLNQLERLSSKLMTKQERHA